MKSIVIFYNQATRKGVDMKDGTGIFCNQSLCRCAGVSLLAIAIGLKPKQSDESSSIAPLGERELSQDL